jgi:2-hydroxy-6-oxonona-2,4-dienedioate hydrolase
MGSEAAATPADAVAKIESLSTQRLTPCGTGSMVWHIWGQGRPLVLLHGASGSWTHWIHNILPLAAHFRVFAPDMPGFGDSAAPPDAHSAHKYADIVAAGIDELIPPPAALDIVGFSFGGLIGSLAAARLGARIRNLVVLGAGGMGLPHTPPRTLVPLRSSMTPEVMRRAYRENLGLMMIEDSQKIDDLAVHVQMENVRRSRFKVGETPKTDITLRALAKVDARISGIWGGSDAFSAPYVDARRAALAAIQPGLDFRVIDGAGHWVIYEAAAQVNAALLEILGRDS